MPQPPRKDKSQAVEVVAGPRGCDAARELEGQRFLASEAPLLPLRECTASFDCDCKYQKWDDRRQETRRMIEGGISSQFFSAEEKRVKKRDRRSSE